MCMHSTLSPSLSTGAARPRTLTPGRSSTTRVWAPARLKRQRSISRTWSVTGSHSSTLELKTMTLYSWSVGSGSQVVSLPSILIWILPPLPSPPLPSPPLPSTPPLSFPPLLSSPVQAFSKKCIDRRKEWLTQWLQQRRERRDQGLNESLLYAEQIDHISYSDFINKELILFSNMDNERSIASSVDGEGRTATAS